MEIQSFKMVVIALCILTSCTTETENNITAPKEKDTSIDQTSSDTVNIPTDSVDTLLKVAPLVITQDELARHNQWLRDNIKWDTVYQEIWLEDKKIKQHFDHPVLSYRDSVLKINGKTARGMEDEVSNGFLNSVALIYCSQKSTSGKYLTAMISMNYDYLLYHVDIEKGSATMWSSRGPYTWTSWSPDDTYSLNIAGYEGYTEFYYYNNVEKANLEFEIHKSISSDKLMVFDELSLQWISNNEFTIDVYLFCNPYGMESNSENCIEWNQEMELGEKHTYLFSCTSESVKELN
jgi:hypothetical protein